LATQPVNFAVDDDGIEPSVTPPSARAIVAMTPTANAVTPVPSRAMKIEPHVPSKRAK